MRKPSFKSSFKKVNRAVYQMNKRGASRSVRASHAGSDSEGCSGCLGCLAIVFLGLYIIGWASNPSPNDMKTREGSVEKSSGNDSLIADEAQLKAGEPELAASKESPLFTQTNSSEARGENRIKSNESIPLDKKPLPEFDAEKDIPLGQQQASQFAKVGFRLWSTPNGKYTVDAKYVSANDKVVTLIKNDGSTIDVEVSRLCEKDIAYLAERKKSGLLNQIDEATSPSKAETDSKDILEVEKRPSLGMSEVNGGAFDARNSMKLSEIESRLWSTPTGKYTVSAKFVSATDRVVKLLKDDGSEIEVQIERLCEKDIAYITELQSK